MASVRDDETWRVLHQRLRGISKRRAALDAEEARCLREAVAVQLWRRLGYVHLNEYLEHELGYAPQAGSERVRVAQALARLPRIEASLGEGVLSFSAVRELTRVATADSEQAWLDAAHGKNLRQIEAMVSGKRPGDRPEDPARPELVNRILRLELSPSAYAAFRQIQAVLADEHGGRLDDSALIETLCRRALEGGAGSERPAHQIAFTICESCRRGWQNGAGREIEVGAEVLDRARCDAELVGSLEASEPARVTSTITPRLRRQVLARDHHGCTVPGCRAARNLDVHHIRFRSDGGGNELSNLLTLCSGHHALVHAGQILIRGEAPHALEFSWREIPERETAVARGDNAPGMSRSSESTAFRCEAPEPPPRPTPARDIRPTIHRGDRAPADPLAENTARDSNAPAPAQRLAPPRPASGGPDIVHDETEISTVESDACAALTTAGFALREARAAVSQARPHVGAEATLEQLVREALRRCTVPASSASHAPAR
jgi:Holliday junction resolvase RuvA-like protein